MNEHTPSPPAPDAVPAPDATALDALEADLAAVEHAIDRLDRVTEQGIGGEDAAREIAVAVPLERFDLPAS